MFLNHETSKKLKANKKCILHMPMQRFAKFQLHQMCENNKWVSNKCLKGFCQDKKAHRVKNSNCQGKSF